MMNNNNNNTTRRILADPGTSWSRQEDKIFEKALVTTLISELLEDDDGWHKIADLLPGKSADDVKLHYEVLLCDLQDIESGLIDLPKYTHHETCEDSSTRIQKRTQSPEVDRKKGRPWTKDEHKLFLEGLRMYGKGDWRSISRNLIKTRTPTQVASHAQKYYLRHNTEKSKRKRTSIHDITTPLDILHVPVLAPVPAQPPNLPQTPQSFYQNFESPHL